MRHSEIKVFTFTKIMNAVLTAFAFTFIVALVSTFLVGKEVMIPWGLVGVAFAISLPVAGIVSLLVRRYGA